MQMLENYLLSVLKGWSALLCTGFWDFKSSKMCQQITLQHIKKIMIQYSCLTVFSDDLLVGP